VNEFKLKQQLQACQTERDAWKARAEDYRAKLQKPAMIGQPNKLREEIAFWKAEARAIGGRLQQEIAKLTENLALRDAELADTKLKVTELVEKLNLANNHTELERVIKERDIALAQLKAAPVKRARAPRKAKVTSE